MANNKKQSKVGKLLRRMFNVREWIDWSRIKAGGEYISKGAKQVFIATPMHPVESFAEAQRRLKLTDDNVAIRGRALLRTSLIMLCLAILLFCYTIYHFIWGSIHSGILSFSLFLLSMGFAFRYHFWYFQITQRKLGCTFNDWVRQGLMGKKS